MPSLNSFIAAVQIVADRTIRLNLSVVNLMVALWILVTLDCSIAGGCGDPETPGEPKFNVGDQVYYLVTKPVGPRAFPVQKKVFCTVTRVGKGADGGYVYTLSNGQIIGENSLYC